MSYSKATLLKPPVAVAILVLAAAVLWLAAASQAGAGSDGSVSLNPADATVGAGGTTDVAINATPPSSTLAIWIIEVHYDPAIVQVPRDGNDAAECTNIANPGGGVATAAGCDTRDDVAGGGDDTFVAFGGWIENDGGATGLDAATVLSTVTFEGLGDPGQCSDLEVIVASFLDPEAGEHAPTVTSGEICISEGTNVLWGDVDCSGSVSPSDSLKILIKDSGGNPSTGTCPSLGTDITVNGNTIPWGDIDCSDSLSPSDSLKILIKDSGGNPSTGACPGIGTQAAIS